MARTRRGQSVLTDGNVCSPLHLPLASRHSIRPSTDRSVDRRAPSLALSAVSTKGSSPSREITAALKSAAAGQPGPAAYSSRTVNGAARASPPDSATHDRRTAPAHVIGRGRGTITAAAIPTLPRPDSTARCVETGRRTRPRHDALPPRVQRPAATARATPRAARRDFLWVSARVLRDERQRDRELVSRVRGMSALNEIQLGGERITLVIGMCRVRRSGRFTFGSGWGRRFARLSTFVTGTFGAGGSPARPGRSSTSAVDRRHRADRGAGDRERRRERDREQRRRSAPRPGGPERGTGGITSPTSVARARARTRARSSGGSLPLDLAWREQCLQLRLEVGSVALHFDGPSSATAERRRPAPCVPCRAGIDAELRQGQLARDLDDVEPVEAVLDDDGSPRRGHMLKGLRQQGQRFLSLQPHLRGGGSSSGSRSACGASRARRRRCVRMTRNATPNSQGRSERVASRSASCGGARRRPPAGGPRCRRGARRAAAASRTRSPAPGRTSRGSHPRHRAGAGERIRRSETIEGVLSGRPDF